MFLICHYLAHLSAEVERFLIVVLAVIEGCRLCTAFDCLRYFSFICVILVCLDIKIAGFRIVFVLKATLCLLLEFVRIVLCLKGNTKTDNEGDNKVVNSHNLNFNVRQIYVFLCNREYENVRFLSQEPRVLEFSRLLFVRRSGRISRFRQEIIIKMTIWER